MFRGSKAFVSKGMEKGNSGGSASSPDGETAPRRQSHVAAQVAAWRTTNRAQMAGNMSRKGVSYARTV